jgi:hypothetical protein
VKLADISGGEEEYLNAKIEELETNSKIKNIGDWYRGISDFMKGYQPRTNIVKDEKGACYTIQLMLYSHFKQHLKPIKCQKLVCKYKTPTCFGLFSQPSSRGPPLCFVPLLFLLLICVC